MIAPKKKQAPLAVVVPEGDRPGPEWDRVRKVDSSARYILEEAAVLYQAVRGLECYAIPQGDEQVARVRKIVERARKALAEIVVDCGDLREIAREGAAKETASS